MSLSSNLATLSSVSRPPRSTNRHSRETCLFLSMAGQVTLGDLLVAHEGINDTIRKFCPHLSHQEEEAEERKKETEGESQSTTTELPQVTCCSLILVYLFIYPTSACTVARDAAYYSMGASALLVSLSSHVAYFLRRRPEGYRLHRRVSHAAGW